MNYERPVAAALVLSIAGSVIFAAAYARNSGTGYLGLGAALAAAGLCAAFAMWQSRLLPQRTWIEKREEPGNGPALANLDRTIEADRALMTRPLLIRLLLGALAASGLAALFPIRSLGPAPGNALFETKWKRGRRLVLDDGRPIRFEDINVDAAVTAFPEGAVGDAASQLMLIRLPNVCVAFSKVCTHAGCPVALYRAAQRQLLCPCHQSLFDVLDGGRVLAGPAARPLPQLPIYRDPAGFLRAAGDFPEPIGPGFWERGA